MARVVVSAHDLIAAHTAREIAEATVEVEAIARVTADRSDGQARRRRRTVDIADVSGPLLWSGRVGAHRSWR